MNCTKHKAQSMRFCSYCYLQTETLYTCGKCKKRKYCSKDCQKLDWKGAGHKVYCGIAGEINVDYEIREAGEAGLGVFRLRKFKKSEKIMVEHPIMYGSDCLQPMPRVPESARVAVDTLLPLGGSMKEKLLRNGMGVSDLNGKPVLRNETAALFVCMSRVNHRCFGNPDHA
jgi:MYND finger